MLIDTKSDISWQLTNSVNTTQNGYVSRIATTTPPGQLTATAGGVAGDGVINFGGEPMGQGGTYCPNTLVLLPFGAGASTNTFSLKILGWTPTNLGTPRPLWVPVVIGAWQCTLGTGTGIAGSDLASTNLFTTTITLTTGPVFQNAVAPNTIPPIIPDMCQLSPGSNDIGMIVCRSFGFRFLEVIFTTGASATNCNALYRKM